jgi:hypothetical protein
MKAYLGIRDQPHYRHDAFVAGLKAAGHEVMRGTPLKPDAATLFVNWNRYGSGHEVACAVERAGGKVLIAENAYLKGRKDGGDYIALARSYHNDAAVIAQGSAERWAALGVELQPWRIDGGHILVCPNRPFGVPGRIMPPHWADEVAARLRKLTQREVRVRPHPGNHAPRKPLTDDLAGAWACVIWSSSAGVASLVAGVPVFQCAPRWICTEAASLNLDMIGDPAMDDDRRLGALHTVAAAQWTTAEIASGRAFTGLLRTAHQEKIAVGA